MKLFLWFLFLSFSTITLSQNLGEKERLFYLRLNSSQERGPDASSATLIDNCNTQFSDSNYGAGVSGNCKGDPQFGGFWNNLDCNGTTGNGNGADVGYSVENDIYYYFCPQTPGTWTINISPSNCTGGSGGWQYSVFQASSSNNFHTLLAGGFAGMQLFSSATLSITPSNTTDCIYIQIDGYAGTECNFNVSVTAPGPCVLPVELNEFTADCNYITWSVLSETNNEKFILDHSTDGENWTKYKEFPGQGTSSIQKTYFTLNEKQDLSYWRLQQVDYDGNKEILGIKVSECESLNKECVYFNILGQEVTETYPGLKYKICTNK